MTIFSLELDAAEEEELSLASQFSSQQKMPLLG